MPIQVKDAAGNSVSLYSETHTGAQATGTVVLGSALPDGAASDSSIVAVNNNVLVTNGKLDALLAIEAAQPTAAQVAAVLAAIAVQATKTDSQPVVTARDPNVVSVLMPDITDTASHAMVTSFSGKFTRVLRLTLANSGGTSTRVDVLSGATIIWSAYVPTLTTQHFTFDRQTAPTTAVNTALNVQAAAGTTLVVSFGGITE